MRKFSLLSLIIACLPLCIYAQEANKMLKNGLGFLETPYVAHTLEVNDKEDLVVNCDEVDCTTFVEYVLAMSLCEDQGDDMQESEFAQNLQKIRYRNGIINGYTSRLHYIADWINNGVKQGFIEDITAQKSPKKMTLAISYMSTHADKYKQLKNSPADVAVMASYEKELTGKTVNWLPKDDIPTNGLSWIKNGDIIAITTNIKGLDVCHMGIAIYIQGKLHLLHASSTEMQVVVERVPLKEQLKSNKVTTGIRVLRMKTTP